MNFSVCLIARNEAETLPRMVASLKEFQDRGGEVLVLDTGSTDNTVQVAESLGCKVEAVGDKFRIFIDKDLADKINEKFVIEGEAPVVKEGDSLFDFASARNYIAEFASNDVIATPDCDEIYTKLDLDKLNEVIAGGAEQLEYEFVFSHDDLGNPVVKFRHCKFYNRKKLKWVGIIHEVLAGQANMVYLGEDIIKLEHYQNEKTNRSGYLKGLAVDCYKNPDNDRNSHYFAREMMYLGRYRSAIKEFKNHIAMNRWPTEAAQSMMFIGDCYNHLGDYDEMLKWYGMSIAKEVRREPLMHMAEYYFSKGMYSQVVAYCEAALTVKQLPFYSNHQPYYEDIPHALLYVSYWWLGDREKSKEHWEKALAFCPTHPKYLADGKFYNLPAKLDIYTENIKNNVNFSFVKRGDGELACMNGEVGANCDGHNYSPELGQKLKESFEFLKDKADIVEFADQKNYNILLHRTDNDLKKLSQFYKTIKASPRRKFFVGPKRLEGVCDLLGATLVEMPLVNAFDYYLEGIYLDSQENDIFIFSCGMLAKVLIADLLKHNPNVTCIDAGSAFDPIFVGKTRTEQAEMEDLKRLYEDRYVDPGIEGMMTPAEMEWLYQTSKTVDTFLEIGSFKGKSTHAILSGGARTVYAVDHFVGSSDPIETGNNDTYDAFLKNVGHFKNLNVRRMSSLEAVREFEEKSLDVVFIDGGHRIQEITEDIVAWLPKTKKILCGHDYHDAKAVRMAVDILLGPVQVCDRIWYKVLDGTETLDMDKARRLARYLDMDFVIKMFGLTQDTHPEKLYVLKEIGDSSDKIIYDLGCGLHKTLDTAIGIDLLPSPEPSLVASLDNLSVIPDEYADILISRHSLEHMADTNKTLNEWTRILKPTGKILFVLPNDEVINTMDPILSAGGHLQAFTPVEFIAAVQKTAGLWVEKLEEVVPGWSFGGVLRKISVPKISFVIPTLGREEGLKRCLDSIEKLNYPKNKIEVIVKPDSFENRIGVPNLLKQGIAESTGDWVVFASNDTEFTPDSIIEALKAGDGGYAAFNTGELYPDEGNINEHFMIRRDIIEQIGEVFDTEFYHCGCDNLLWAKMKKLGINQRAEKAIVHHYHFSRTGQMDKVYELAYSMKEHDRELLAKKLAEL